MLNLKTTARARASGPQFLSALWRLLSFPQNQDSTEVKLLAAIMHAQQLAHAISVRAIIWPDTPQIQKFPTAPRRW